MGTHCLEVDGFAVDVALPVGVQDVQDAFGLKYANARALLDAEVAAGRLVHDKSTRRHVWRAAGPPPRPSSQDVFDVLGRIGTSVNLLDAARRDVNGSQEFTPFTIEALRGARRTIAAALQIIEPGR